MERVSGFRFLRWELVILNVIRTVHDRTEKIISIPGGLGYCEHVVNTAKHNVEEFPGHTTIQGGIQHLYKATVGATQNGRLN